jgi:ACS family hexuronate transporter-like MFS transporter
MAGGPGGPIVRGAAIAGAATEHDAAGVVSAARWAMVGMVFLATFINYLDRQTLSVAAPVIIDQFHLSNVD